MLSRALLYSTALAASLVSAWPAYAQVHTSPIVINNGSTQTFANGANIATTAINASGRGVNVNNNNSQAIFGTFGGSGLILDVTTEGGGSAYAIYAGAGGVVTVHGDVNASTLGGTSVAPNAHGIYANNTGSRIDIHGNAMVVTDVTGSYGIRVHDGAALTIDGLANVTTLQTGTGIRVSSNDTPGTELTVGSAVVETHGASSAGIVVQGGTTSIGGTLRVLGDATVTVHGMSSAALMSYNGSTLEVGGSAFVTTEGDDSYGIYARDTGVLTVAGNSSVVTEGAASFGVVGLRSGVVTLADTFDITTSGADSSGILINGIGSDVKLNDPSGVVTTTGDGSHAIEITNGADKTFDGTPGNIFPTDISVSGDGAAVVAATDGGTLTLDSVVLEQDMVDGSGSLGILADDGTVTLQDSSTGGTEASVTNNGRLELTDVSDAAGSHVDVSSGGTLDLGSITGGDAKVGSLGGDSTGTVDLGGTDLVLGGDNANGDGSLVDGADFAGTVVNGGELTKEGSGSQSFSGNIDGFDSMTIAEGAVVVAGFGNNITVKSGATLGGTGTVGGVVTVESGGIVSPGGDNVVGTLTINDLDYANGAVFRFDLQQGGTPSVDKVLVSSVSSAAGKITIKPVVSGSGGLGNGPIALVEVTGGASLADDAFVLGSQVVAGGYVYTLSSTTTGADRSFVLNKGPLYVGSGGATTAIPALPLPLLLALGAAVGLLGRRCLSRRA